MENKEQAIKSKIKKIVEFLGRNWKKIILLTALTAVILFSLAAKATSYVDKPEFCKKCHSMKPFYTSWAESSHQSVSCFQCHFGYTQVVKPKPLPITAKKVWVIELQDRTVNVSKQMNAIKGFIARTNVQIDNFRSGFAEARSKVADLRKVYIMVTGGSTSGDNEGFWGNCMECHKDVFEANSKTDSFGHVQHLEKDMACNQCHRNVVHGRTIKPTRQDCVSCHSETLRPSSHKSPQFRISHGQSYIKVGGCELCHLKGLEEPLCTNCHGMKMPHHPEYTINHIEEINQVGIKTCMKCHTDEEQPKFAGGVTPRAMPCGNCHGPNLPHKGYQSILRTHGSLAAQKGTKGCLSCHISKSCTDCHGMAIPHPPGFIKKHMPEAKKYGFDKCLKCHDRGGKAVYCGNCHVVDIPHPPDWNSTHGPKKDQNCNYCHSRKNPANPGAPWAADNFCQKCHGIEEHFSRHSNMPEYHLEDCLECHGSMQACISCHGMDL